MSFSEYDVLNFLIIRYTNPPLVPKYTLIIFSKSGGLAFSYIPLNLLDLFILKLTLANILRNVESTSTATTLVLIINLKFILSNSS
jgi:hypothetical protein